MAQLARWQRTVQDAEGNIQPGAEVVVRDKATGLLAQLFSDRAGTEGITNPFDADDEGFAAFHVIGGAYEITATKDDFEVTWDWVGIGTASEHDYGDAYDPQGAWSIGTTYSKGQLVSHVEVGSQPYAFLSNIDGNVGHEPSITGSPLRGESNAYWTVVGIIPSPTIFALAFAIQGPPLAGELVEGHVFTDAVTFPADFANGQAIARVAPTATAVFAIKHNDSTVGTLTFDAGEEEGVFDMATELDVVAGDRIDLEAPSPKDATLSGVKVTLRGTR